MARDPDAPTLICFTTCRARYGLTSDDLEALDCITCRNPHYRNAAPMRLYVEDDVIALALDKERYEAERRQYRIDHAEEIATERVRREQERKDRIAAEAKDRRDASKAYVGRFYAFNDPYVPRPTPGNRWPIDVLGRVMVMLARSLEPDGIRGPGIVTMDLLNAAMAFDDMRVAAADGFAELGRLCPGIGFGFDYRDPMAAKARDLQDAACVLGLRSAGSKPETAHRILDELGLVVPPWPCVPLSVVRAVAEERRSAFLPAELRRVRLQDPSATAILLEAGGLANVRGLRAGRMRLASRWPDMNAFMTEPRRVEPPPIIRPRVRFAECACGNTSASTCAKGMCATCCLRSPGRCDRHNSG
jgi:XPA protein C-terminus